MTAKRQYQHDLFQDTSWGPHGLLNLDIPTLELAPLPTAAMDSQPYSVPTDSLLNNNQTRLASSGLAVLGGLLLLGATLMGTQLWQQQTHQQQHVFTAAQPFVVNAAPMALAAIAGSPTTPNPIVLPDTAKILQEAQATARTPYGRDDPFSPLVSPELPESANAANGSNAEDVPKPPVLSFVGIIEGASGSGRLVAILKSTGETPTTYIKEPGDRFEVDGHRVMLKRVNKRDVAVVIDGLVENLSLQEYSDNATNANRATGSPTGSVGSRSNSSTAMPMAGRNR
ncbi:MAG: hypothetical protein QE263_06510 [Vampirovibrionales bacterium]|nr:hypothetical protein [Vampirovibrionales bacterium]